MVVSLKQGIPATTVAILRHISLCSGRLFLGFFNLVAQLRGAFIVFAFDSLLQVAAQPANIDVSFHGHAGTAPPGWLLAYMMGGAVMSPGKQRRQLFFESHVIIRA